MRMRWPLALGVLALLLLVGAMIVWLANSARVGMAIGALGLVGTLIGLYLAWLQYRDRQIEVMTAVTELAAAVSDAEGRARRNLLGGADRAIDVAFAFKPSPAHDAAGAAGWGRLDEVASYYRALSPGRLVITGAPGAGKTVLALELILTLLEQRSDHDPVPIRMQAASLDTRRPQGEAVQEWLVGHLTRAFGLSSAIAEKLVTARMVLPVVDGLDEMDPADDPEYSSRTAQAIRALNAYQSGRHRASLVVTCRTVQYQALQRAQEWLRDAAVVEIQPVSIDQVQAFLTNRVMDKRRWQSVVDAMESGQFGPLARSLSTPWGLTLAVTVYEQRNPVTGAYIRDPGELTNPQLDTDNKVRDHLLRLFIPAATAAQRNHHSYRPDHVQRWLVVLAQFQASELVLFDLWPLAGPRLTRAIAAGLSAAVYLAVGAAVILPLTPASPVRSIAGLAILAGLIGGCMWPRGESRKSSLIAQRRPMLSGRHELATVLTDAAKTGFATGILFGICVGLRGGFWGTTMLVLLCANALMISFSLVSVLVGSTESEQHGDNLEHPVVVWMVLVFGLVVVLVLGLLFVLRGGFWGTTMLVLLCANAIVVFGLGFVIQDDSTESEQHGDRREHPVVAWMAIALGLVLALVLGLLFVLRGGFWGTTMLVLLCVALVIGLGFVIQDGSTESEQHGDRREHPVVAWMAIALGLVLVLVLGLLFALGIGLVGGLALGPTGGIRNGLAGGLMYGLAAGVVSMRPAMRLAALVLCTRRWTRSWLPWRLARFLRWCYYAGLMRAAGISYQFRHEELKDYLARIRPAELEALLDPEPPAGGKTGS